MIAHAILPFLVLLPICHSKIDESSVPVKGSVEAVTIPNLFPLIKENSTWLNTLDVRPGPQSEYKKVPYETSTSIDENGRTLYHTRVRLRTREADDTTDDPISEAVEEIPPHSDVPITENSEDALPEVEATIESGPTNRTEEFFPNPPAFTLSRLVRHA